MFVCLGYVEVIKELLKNGANINKTNDKSWTPLHVAADDGKLFFQLISLQFSLDCTQFKFSKMF